MNTSNANGSSNDISSNNWVEFEKEETLKFCFYFNVTYENLTKREGKNIMEFKFRPILNPDLTFSIEKRFSDFLTFQHNFKDSTKAKTPSLPKKIMLMDESQLEKRGRHLEKWLMVVTNERMFHNKMLFDFIGFPRDLRQSLLKHRPVHSMKSDFDFDIGVESFE